MEKISKGHAGFQFRPETEYTCGQCIALKSIAKGKGFGCAYIGPGDPVSPQSGGCDYYIHGAPDQVPWLGTYTKVELDYAENGPGFSCKRCEYFSPEKSDCSKVDKDSPGDAPGKILPNTCCSFWEPDKQRAKMATPQLLVMIAEAQKPKQGTNMAIEIKKSHQGLLHEDLGVKEGQKIPLASLMKAKKSKSPAVRRRATFAVNARGWNK